MASTHISARHTLLSMPIKLVWAGWETDTLSLQRNGWEIAAEQDYAYGTMRLALRHTPLRLRGITASTSFEFMAAARSPQMLGEMLRNLRLPVQHMASSLEVRTHDNFANFRQIDAEPQMVMREMKSIDDLGIWATPLARTEEIIVDPDQVNEVLQKILAAQSGKQKEIRARQRREREAGQPVRQQTFHAQIISLDEARTAA